MRVRRRVFPLVVVLGLLGATSAVALAASASWGHAITVPGSAALNTGGEAGMDSISCAAAGSCAVVGSYSTGGHDQAFVANEKNGTWSKAVAVPGTTAPVHPWSEVYSISCAAAGFCAAGGYYADGSGHDRAFVVSEKNGVWSKAVEVSGSDTLFVGPHAEVDSISCTAAGSCAAGGYYYDGSDHYQAFVVSEKNGVWSKAIEVPGTATLNADGAAAVDSVSCAAAGSCAAGGYYYDGSDHMQAFVVSEKNGVWSKAGEVPGTASLNVAGVAAVGSISCAGAGSCAAGGYYTVARAPGDNGLDATQAFVVSEKNGVWRKAVEVPGTAKLNAGREAGVRSISCATAGYCAAGGSYTDGSDNAHAFVVSETNGVWSTAVKLPGSTNVNSISCAGAGSCAAGGGNLGQAVVAREQNGVWSKAVRVPGSATLGGGHVAYVVSISCATASSCGAGGLYTSGSGRTQAFVTTPALGDDPVHLKDLGVLAVHVHAVHPGEVADVPGVRVAAVLL
jgi:hypothetical protein